MNPDTGIMNDSKRYFSASVIYLLVSTAAGAALSGFYSSNLIVSGWFAFHAYSAFMGFGILMAIGLQKSLVSRRGASVRDFIFIPITLCHFLIWVSFVLQKVSGDSIWYYCVIAGALAAGVLVTAFTVSMFRSYGARDFIRDVPARFFATALFMQVLAYMQLAHICTNLIRPGTLPFSETLFLRHNYLALSFPISLTIMGAIYTPYQRALDEGAITHRAHWDAQYTVLVTGVFGLFFSILFDNPAWSILFSRLQEVFSAVLLFSIFMLAAAMLKDRLRVPMMSPEAGRRYASAIAYLVLAGFAGFGLGYGLEPKYPAHYFLLQSHIHLALMGWAGMGLTGAFYNVCRFRETQAAEIAEKAQFISLHSSVIAMVSGILLQSPALRAVSGVFMAISCAALLVSIQNSCE